MKKLKILLLTSILFLASTHAFSKQCSCFIETTNGAVRYTWEVADNESCFSSGSTNGLAVKEELTPGYFWGWSVTSITTVSFHEARSNC